jgi:hypothetical protein
VNFFERGALKRASKGVSHLLQPGEVLADFDVCELLVPRGRADLLLSDRALFLIPGGNARLALRISLSEISEVDYQPDNPAYAYLLVVRTWDGSEFMFAAKGRWRQLPRTLQSRVPDRLVRVHRLDLYEDGRGVDVRQLRTRHEGAYEWAVDFDDGLSEGDPDFERRLEAAIQPLIAAHKGA